MEVVECSGVLCGRNLLATRVSGSGPLIGSEPARLNAAPVTEASVLHVSSDGENYIVSFVGGGSRFGRQIFGFRVGPDLQPIDFEEPGALLMPESLGTVPPTFGTSMATRLVGAPRFASVIWVDTLNFDPGSATVTWTSPISVQRVFRVPCRPAIRPTRSAPSGR